ncbi:menaquinone-dependent protoporphyrinogen IX dehydrogenase [Shewanella sp. 202IG2-18]|uniref:menaquinone-dependent protoporphyrinogen IX dehydrogenase n=1 Tax=Parashewanella hymeniacidonis TaxID=2807618 RepID=UPI00196011FA|nr:menaquinone-dependent protoporphyrinogen IX dehydrogenase [Parashewanella hymeniacidonis]MBM7071079.1 menaquinone-dependent protoporphyrinogen IX dehydrogenase [Parashewanella hymeniacidonis]
MQKIVIIYSTVDGQTKTICERMRTAMSVEAEVKLVELDNVDSKLLEQADKVLVGASIRYGKHRPELLAFAEQYQPVLDEKQNGFFTVNVVARKPEKNTPETNPYMKKFLLLSPWQPKVKGVFAGKINYPQYGFFDKTMIRFIMWLTKGPTDTSGCFEFTDWDHVERFAREFANS